MAENRDAKNHPPNEAMHAKATTTVHQYEPTVYDKPKEGPTLARIHLEESFDGDIQGHGVVECLQAAVDAGSASLVGIERVAGEIAGRHGTFLLQLASTVTHKKMTAEWFVIPGSGTDQLAGLRGKGGFHAHLGESGRVTLDYWFE